MNISIESGEFTLPKIIVEGSETDTPEEVVRVYRYVDTLVWKDVPSRTLDGWLCAIRESKPFN